MSNGVQVIVAGDRTPLPGSLRLLPSHPSWPITLPPTTLSDYVMMTTPAPPNQKSDPNDFVTKTYITTYTYLTTFSESGSTLVSSRERVVSNVVTEEIKATKPPSKASDHVTLSSSLKLTTGVYHTTYTYFNTMIDGELPLVVTSKKTVANTVTEQPSSDVQPTEVPLHSTNTYLSTFAYTKTLSDGDLLKVVSTEDILTRVIVTESDHLPSTVYLPSLLSSILSTSPLPRQPVTTDVTKTYFVTYTYFKTLLESGQTTVKSEVATSSDVFTEKYTINPKRTQVLSSTDVSMNMATDMESSSNVVATKTYLTTFTYFTTLLQDNSSPSIVVKSRTKVIENVVMETIDPGQINLEYQSLIDKFKGDKPIEFNEVRPLHITPTKVYSTRPTSTAEVISSFEDVISSNIVTGSTVVSSEGSEESASDSSRTPTPVLVVESKTHSSANKPTDKNSQIKTTSITPTKSPTNQMESYLKIGSIGLNALGPMINAMAGLIKNNLKANKRNDTVEQVAANPDPPQALVKRPPATLFTKPPANIFSGLNDEPETAESQNFEGFNQFQDIHQRHKSPLPLRTNSGPQILGGGIPISPGQVITANSDVIIGKPAIHGPRPPPKKNFENDNVEGMKPPPPPPPLPPPLLPASPLPPVPTPLQHTPKWHHREQENHPILPNSKIHLKNVGRLPPDREFGDLKLGEKLSINLNNPPKIHAGVKTHDFKNDHKPPPEFLKIPPYTPSYPATISSPGPIRPHGPILHSSDPLYHLQLQNHHEGHSHHQTSHHEGPIYYQNKHEGPHHHHLNQHEGSHHHQNKYEGPHHYPNQHEGSQHHHSHDGPQNHPNQHEGPHHYINKLESPHFQNQHQHETFIHLPNKPEGSYHNLNQHEGILQHPNKHDGPHHNPNNHHEGSPHPPNYIDGPNHFPNFHENPHHHLKQPESHPVSQIVKHGPFPYTTRPHYQHYGGFPQQKNITRYNVHYHPPGKIPSDNSGDHAFITPPINHFIPNSTLGITEKIRPTDFTETSPYDNELNHNSYNPIVKQSLPNKHIYEGISTPPRPLLVNIQPSQVANVIIPHGSSVALIFNNRTG